MNGHSFVIATAAGGSVLMCLMLYLQWGAFACFAGLMVMGFGQIAMSIDRLQIGNELQATQRHLEEAREQIRANHLQQLRDKEIHPGAG